jgi:hypothetical protein
LIPTRDPSAGAFGNVTVTAFDVVSTGTKSPTTAVYVVVFTAVGVRVIAIAPAVTA